MARSYKRDARGRFAGGGGGGNRRPATKGFSTGRNRLTRDNSGKITSQGGNGATARGGRLRTAGGNLRARQVGKMKGAPSGVVGRGGKVRGGKVKVKPAAAAPKGYGRGVDAAKVERMIGRLRQDPVRNGGYNRVNSVKSRNTKDTRTRALDFLNKAGGLTVKKKGGRPENPKNLTRDQLIGNIAAKISKPTRRSTLRNRSNDVKNRQESRRQIAELSSPQGMKKRFGNVSRMHGKPITVGKGVQRAEIIPGRLRLNTAPSYRVQSHKYVFTKTRPAKAGEWGTTSVANLAAKDVTVRNNASIRTRKQASQAQSARRAGVRKLRGTGQLGRPNTNITRGKARQATIGGGVATTYGRFQMRARRR